jgi:hypothetical protein
VLLADMREVGRCEKSREGTERHHIALPNARVQLRGGRGDGLVERARKYLMPWAQPNAFYHRPRRLQPVVRQPPVSRRSLLHKAKPVSHRELQP